MLSVTRGQHLLHQLAGAAARHVPDGASQHRRAPGGVASRGGLRARGIRCRDPQRQGRLGGPQVARAVSGRSDRGRQPRIPETHRPHRTAGGLVRRCRCWIATTNAGSAGLRMPAFPNAPRLKGPVLQMQTQQMIGSAAMAGQGMALLTPALFDRDLDAGRLIQVFPIVVSHYDVKYYLVYPEEPAESRQNQGFPRLGPGRDRAGPHATRNAPRRASRSCDRPHGKFASRVCPR